MPSRANSKKSIKEKTIESMQKLGTYKDEYEPIIDIYCELKEQYDLYTKQLKKNKYKCEEFTAAGGTKKSALIATLETLRKDILQYSDRLCLNPKSMMEEKNKKITKQSPLAKALSELE